GVLPLAFVRPYHRRTDRHADLLGREAVVADGDLRGGGRRRGGDLSRLGGDLSRLGGDLSRRRGGDWRGSGGGLIGHDDRAGHAFAALAAMELAEVGECASLCECLREAAAVGKLPAVERV